MLLGFKSSLHLNLLADDAKHIIIRLSLCLKDQTAHFKMNLKIMFYLKLKMLTFKRIGIIDEKLFKSGGGRRLVIVANRLIVEEVD